MHLENLTVMGISFTSVRLEQSKQSATLLEVIYVNCTATKLHHKWDNFTADFFFFFFKSDQVISLGITCLGLQQILPQSETEAVT